MTEKWTEPRNSISKVSKAGRIIRKAILDFEETSNKDLTKSLHVLLNWRSAHAYPMHALLVLVRRKARLIDKNALIVQRLKRLPTIMDKLTRFENMSLGTMQDIGGCRAVVKTTAQAERLRHSMIFCNTRHVFVRQYDYIKNPKESGYRGIHLIYKYGATKTAYKNLLVEIQIRSRIQHSWATAVEVVDTFTKQSLKTDRGTEDWALVFQLISDAFAQLEKRPTYNDFSDSERASMKHLCNKLHVVETLGAFAISTRQISSDEKISKNGFILLELDSVHSTVDVSTYEQAEFQHASEEYTKREEATRNDDTKNIVLVSASSIRNLKKAYPNYFADTEDFVKNLAKVLK